MKIIGVVPARMGSSRFPGKPLYPIFGRPMVEHVFERAKLYKNWNHLCLATCDKEIEEFGKSKNWPVIMTSDSHTRCLDRVAEAIEKCGQDVVDNDIIVCVQGDEPMLHPDMIDAVVKPILNNPEVVCTVLGMNIIDDAQFRDPNTVKIIHDIAGNVLYTSRAPIPYCKTLTPEVGARRIYGIFAFKWHALKQFNQMQESPLELVESCDSNRICDNAYHAFKQTVAPYPYAHSFSVDSPSDIHLVEGKMKEDVLWGKY